MSLCPQPVSLDPPHMQSQAELMVGQNVLEGLVKYDPKTLQARLALAESWKVSTETTTWTFRLRRGVKFHNGREVKASDVKWCWERAVNPETRSEMATLFSLIKGFDKFQSGQANELIGVKVLDDYTLKVDLRYPFAEFLQVLGHPVAAVYPKEVWEEHPADFGQSLIGTGPFKLASWEEGRELVLKKNPDYWGEKAYLDRVVFQFVENPNEAYLEYKASHLQAAEISVEHFDLAKSDLELKSELKTAPVLWVYFLGFNLSESPFSKDRNLRLALEFAIDRKAIVEEVFKGLFIPATGIAPPGVPGFVSKQSPYEYSLEKARKYWKGAHLKQVELWYWQEDVNRNIVELVQASCEKAGIQVKLSSLNYDAYRDKLARSKGIFFAAGWIADYPSLDYFLYPLFHSSERGNTNFFSYENPTVDRLLKQGRAELSQRERYQLYTRAEREVLKDAPIIPLWFARRAYLVQPQVQGLEWNSLGYVDFSKVWLIKS